MGIGHEKITSKVQKSSGVSNSTASLLNKASGLSSDTQNLSRWLNKFQWSMLNTSGKAASLHKTKVRMTNPKSKSNPNRGEVGKVN